MAGALGLAVITGLGGFALGLAAGDDGTSTVQNDSGAPRGFGDGNTPPDGNGQFGTPPDGNGQFGTPPDGGQFGTPDTQSEQNGTNGEGSST